MSAMRKFFMRPSLSNLQSACHRNHARRSTWSVWGDGLWEWKLIPIFDFEIVIATLVGMVRARRPRDIGSRHIVVTVAVFFDSKNCKSPAAVAVVVLVVGRTNVEDWDAAPTIFVGGVGMPVDIAEDLGAVLGDGRAEPVDLELGPTRMSPRGRNAR